METHENRVKRLRLIWQNFILICIFFAAISCSTTKPTKIGSLSDDPIEKFHQDIDRILQDSTLYQTRVGISIVSLKTGETLYTRNSQKLFHPASNMKLLTTATALKKLGPDYTFPTIVYVDSNGIKNGIVEGNLYLKGYGNPDLSWEDLEKIVKTLKENDLSQINGDLIFDDFYFDSLYLGSGWMWDDASAWEFAPIHALSVNDNCVITRVSPGEKLGDSLLIQMEPPNSYMDIENQGITVDSLDTLNLQKFTVERDWVHASNIIHVTGGLELGTVPDESVIDVIDGAHYTASLFYDLLKTIGISFKGKIYRDRVPENANILFKHQSQPLSLAVFNTNKNSDNLSAEMILKSLGAEIKDPPGTASKGISIIYEYLHNLGVDSTTYRIADGSGVSRYNLVTPDLMILLLRDMDQDFKVQPEFAASLTTAGTDGTLENRLKESNAFMKLRAKTGTLRGVSTLSGYTTADDGEKIVFSMMMEHFVTPTSQIRKIQDRICDLISSFSRKSNQLVKMTYH
jgi:D-alanyl-D-alanine carboxypeptidase/D-alanyl-D-alanine-endopeptidase (penicillin-binding protein 4)